MKRVFLLIMMVLLSSGVAAVGTHLNVTIREVVYRNTTFAESFFLTENVTVCYVNGTLNVTNPGSDTVFDISLQFSNTDSMLTNFTWDASTKFGNQTSGQPNETIIIHIPELRPGNYSTFTYDMSCVSVVPPLDISSTYVNNDTGLNRKVLAGFNWTVAQNITNSNYLGLPINNIFMTITSQDVVWNTSSFNFSLEKLFQVGDWTNVTDTGKRQWTWQPNGGTLAYNETVGIEYLVRSPLSVPFTATYQAIVENLTYDVSFLISNLSLDYVNASAAVNFSFQKRISQPADNTLSHNVTWQITPIVLTNKNITFDLNTVTVWVTENMDPSNDTSDTIWGKLEYNYTPATEINITTPWSGASWYFNYTDGTNSSYPPPVVWMDPYWLITNKYSQIMNYSRTVSGADLYIKYIYVVHGYWLEVQKNVTSIGEDSYYIQTRVENIGNGWTPEYTYVTVYDFVPDEFTVYNMSRGGCPTSECTSLAVSGGSFQGTSYRWNIPWKGTMNSSLGPKNGPDATAPSNYSWNVSYMANGTGPYRTTDLYIVGLDPLKVDGASVSPVIAVITGLQSYTKEIIYLGVVLFLIVINVTNLLITNKINKKLDDTTGKS